ncbi:MAG: transposase [Anaerolineae bacterium]|nr:transposase [Anaerolineae bacterium]
MKDEFSDRHQAIRLRLSGKSVSAICQLLNRSPDWFNRWWQRYRSEGVSGLYDNTHASSQPRRVPADVERIVINVRQRLESPRYAATRYGLIGASAIQAELKALQVEPVPSPRTIERILARNGLSLPKVRLARFVSSHSYPTPEADESNELHQVDLVGPIYLKGKRKRFYILVCRDVFDGAVFLGLARSKHMDQVISFIGESWKVLGRPTRLQLDNGREFVGWGPAARALSRLIRLCLRFGVEPVFIPPAQPHRNGGIENFNGWFQPRLLQRHFPTAAALSRELKRLEQVVNAAHPQRRLSGLTPVQYRSRRKLQRLPVRFSMPTEPLPVAIGRVTFIRQVSAYGKINLLGLQFFVGKRLKRQYVKATIDTKRKLLTVYLIGRIVKRFDYPHLKH